MLLKGRGCASPFFLFIPIFYSAGKELPPCRCILLVLMNIPPHSVWAWNLAVRLLAIDGNPLNDALDYQFYTSAPHFTLTICQNGAQQQISVEKGEYEPFGCNFKTYLGDEKHSCANHCMFCFIDQLPPGMREPLYFKDDDERLSFLYGNYITMTNLTDREVERIIKLHISPIFISVHTTNPQLPYA